MCKSRLAPTLRCSNFSQILSFNVLFTAGWQYFLTHTGQNSPELSVCMSSIVMKMFTISPYFCSMESTYFWLHRVGSPATVKLEKMSSRHAVIGGVNKVDVGLLLIAPTAVEATLRLRPKFHQFNLSLYLLQSWLYNI